jgi:diguanylate cyclase (GGDEF)-like protein
MPDNESTNSTNDTGDDAQAQTNLNRLKRHKKQNHRPDIRPSLATVLNRAFFSLIAIILFVTVSAQLFTSIRSQQRSIRSTQQSIAQNFSDEIADFFIEKFQLLEATTEVVDLAKGDPAQRKLILESVLVTQPSFRQIVLLDREGSELAQFSQISLMLTDQFSSSFQDDVLSQTVDGQKYISPIYIDNITNEPMVVMALPIDVWDFQGILAAEVDLEFMWNLVADLQVGESGYVYVVNETGNLIAFSDTSRVLRGENLQSISQVNSFLKNSNQNDEYVSEAVTYTGLLGSTVVGTYVPLESPNWAVFVEIPWREAYRNIIAQATTAVVIIVIMALTAGAIGSLAARRLSVPLVNLTELADKISSGNLDLEASTAGPSEINRLAVAFNTMTSQLRNLVGTLENRVAERTKELEIANKKLRTQISEIESLQIQLREQAIRDPLTKLYNRRYLDESFEREIARIRRHKSMTSIILLDIDRFKIFNDEHGHLAGDQILRDLAKILLKNVRAEDIACRYGGEEFIVFLSGAPPKIAEIRANSIREDIQKNSFYYEGKTFSITISAGVAVAPLHGQELTELIEYADQALYQAKENGRNQVVLYQNNQLTQ